MKVVLHAHSTWSYDGHWDLTRIARFYGALGIDAVMMTEHDTGFNPASYDRYRQACAAASTARCTLVPGVEYSCPDNDIHILTWGLPRFLAEHRPVTETLEAVAAAGGAAVFAHPVRRAAYRLFNPAWVPLLSGIEIWNRKSDGLTWGREAAALVAQTGLPATVGQDFHRLRHAYPLTMRAKTELIKRHFTPGTRWLGRGLFALWPLSRWLATGAAGMVLKHDGLREKSRNWAEIWRRRPEWKDGFGPPAEGA